MTADLTNPIFTDETAARECFEASRWPNGPVCHFCGETERLTRMHGEKHRAGLIQCNACLKPFTATMGTLLERSHIPLHKWLLAFHLMSASKKGISAHQLHRMLGITYKSAWFMAHRIRHAMTDPNAGPIGGENKVVEMDETYVGGKAANRKNYVPAKTAVVALVERGGEVRAGKVRKVNARTLKPVLARNAKPKSWIITDDSPIYPTISQEFAGHAAVNHSAQEYSRKGGFVTTNNVEAFFSVLKRGIGGVFHHVSEKHLDRYVNEFAFRHNNRTAVGIEDSERAERALKGVEGKRLTYRRLD